MNCFECDSTENIHQHHVIPRSLGGTKTIPLCGSCHGQAHGLNGVVWANHAGLIKRGQEKSNKLSSGHNLKFSNSAPIDLKLQALCLTGNTKAAFGHIVNNANPDTGYFSQHAEVIGKETGIEGVRFNKLTAKLVKKGLITSLCTRGNSQRVYVINSELTGAKYERIRKASIR